MGLYVPKYMGYSYSYPSYTLPLLTTREAPRGPQATRISKFALGVVDRISNLSTCQLPNPTSWSQHVLCLLEVPSFALRRTISLAAVGLLSC